MKYGLVALAFILSGFSIGCGSGSSSNGSGSGGSTTYSLDLVAIQSGTTLAVGKNATDSTNPLNCVGAVLVMNKLFSAAQKVAFGVIDNRFACGTCQIHVKCVPGQSVNVKGYIYDASAGSVGGLVTEKDDTCPTNGEVSLPSATFGTATGYGKFVLTSGGSTDEEYFTCQDPG